MPKKRAKKRWSELTPQQQGLTVVGAAIQITLQVLALRDLRQRRADEVNGPKWAWGAATFINTLGPLAYFVFGRRRADRP
jgi:phosphosulfolactate synthase (CoM biosynthesis protein A)